MPRFAVNVSTLFTEVAFLDRFRAASEAGFEAVECQFPYNFPASEIRERLRSFKLRHVSMNAPAGDWEAGERGLTSSEYGDRFDASINLAREYASTLGCERVHVLTGRSRSTNPPWAMVIDRLGNAADRFALDGVTLLIEPLNPTDFPGYMLDGLERAQKLITDIGRRNVALLFDFYHVFMNQLDPFECLRTMIDRIGHIQFASVPDRADPGQEYTNSWDFLDSNGYAGWVAAEYHPRGQTIDGLGWFNSYRKR